MFLPYESRGVLRRVGNLFFTARLRADVVHITGDVYYCALAVRRRRVVLTVLDLVSLRRLSGWRRGFVSIFWYRLPVWWAGALTAISSATRDELVASFPRSAGKCVVVYCSVGDEFFDGPSTVLERPLRRVLLVGTGPNKNFDRVVAALSGLPISLRIVGPLSARDVELLRRSGLRFTSATDLSDLEMLREYLGSDVLIFVSIYEGFGLPIAEAQAVGIPVVTASTSSMPEVAGKGALIVDPLDEAAIRAAVEDLLDSPGLIESLIQTGRANVARFRSTVIAYQYAALYRRR